MMGFLSIIYNRPLNLAHLVKSVPHWILEIPIIHSTIGQAWAAHPSNGWGAIVPWAPPVSLAAMMASQVSPRPLDLAGIRRYVLRALTPTLYGHKASLNCSASLASRGAVLNGVPQEQQNYSLSFAPGIRKPVATTCAAQNALPRRLQRKMKHSRESRRRHRRLHSTLVAHATRGLSPPGENPTLSSCAPPEVWQKACEAAAAAAEARARAAAVPVVEREACVKTGSEAAPQVEDTRHVDVRASGDAGGDGATFCDALDAVLATVAAPVPGEGDREEVVEDLSTLIYWPPGIEPHF